MNFVTIEADRKIKDITKLGLFDTIDFLKNYCFFSPHHILRETNNLFLIKGTDYNSGDSVVYINKTTKSIIMKYK